MTHSQPDDAERRRRAQQIVSDYEGIYPMYGAFYVQAIRYASGRAQAAFARFAAAAEARASDAEIVASAHEALGHAAALSRFFFPVDKKPLTRARAANLRKSFAVGDNSPLVDRELRNALEHFDERLDDYLLGDIVGYIFPGPMVGDADLADEAIGHIFRLVDPETQTFVLLGRKHDFGAMRCEVDRISALAEAAG